MLEGFLVDGVRGGMKEVMIDLSTHIIIIIIKDLIITKTRIKDLRQRTITKALPLRTTTKDLRQQMEALDDNLFDPITDLTI